jgi:hypothetical protein
MTKAFPNVSEVLGSTPLVRLNRIAGNPLHGENEIGFNWAYFSQPSE